MNTAAIKAWERKDSSTVQSISDRPKRQRRRRRRPGVDIDCTTNDIAVETQRLHPQHISESPSHRTNNINSPNNNRVVSGVSEQTASLSGLNPINITVQVSQHSNFDRDLYIPYQSSLSTRESSSSLPRHPKSAFVQPSPPTSSTPRTADSKGVVPDSQSLPGSSSYEPTSSTSLVVLGADQDQIIHQSFVLHNSTDLESSTGGVAEANESIEDSSAVAVATGQPSVIASERSRSEPAPKITKPPSSSPSGARFPAIPRSISNPTSTHQDQHQCRTLVSKHLSEHHSVHDQVTHIQSAIDSQSSNPTKPRHTQRRQISSEVQIPGSADRNSHQSHPVYDSPTNSLVFQTQVPLAFASQGSRVSLTSAGECSSDLRLSRYSHARRALWLT